MRKNATGTTLVVAALLGVGSLVTPTSVMAGHEYPARVQAARSWAQHELGHTQFACLDKIAARESGWNPHAGRPDGPWGIPQANPGRKMGKGWRDDPMVQTKWMVQYVNGKFGSACAAWAWWQRHGWY